MKGVFLGLVGGGGGQNSRRILAHFISPLNTNLLLAFYFTGNWILILCQRHLANVIVSDSGELWFVDVVFWL